MVQQGCINKIHVSILFVSIGLFSFDLAHSKDEIPIGDTYFNGNHEVPIWFAEDAIAVIGLATNSNDNNQITAVAQQFAPVEAVLQVGDAGTILELQDGQSASELLASSDTSTRASNRLAAVYRSSYDDNSTLMILAGELIVFSANGISRDTLDSVVVKQGNLFFSETLLDGKAYLYTCPSDPSCLAIANNLKGLPEVEHAYPNWIQFREIRGKLDQETEQNAPIATTRFNITDPLFSNQWHLTNTGQSGGTAGEDANVQGAYNQNIGGNYGFPVVVGIVDDGLELTHEDFNLFSGNHIDIRDGDSDPSPGASDFHGTAVAGVAAADGFNGIGVSGVAPEAVLAGIRLIGGGATDAMEASALTHELTTFDYIDIYNNSWGPSDNGALWSTGPLVEAALETGVQIGRAGLGTNYVWAGGNGLTAGDNSNYDAYANSRYTIAVAASTNTGVQSFYSEPGANILVNAPSNGGSLGITTTDITGTNGYDLTNYTSTFGGTSSASPLVAGVIALMIDVNQQLNWRDIQKILAITAEVNDSGDLDWFQNGAGHWVNHKYGFGRVDATAAVNVASVWQGVGTEVTTIESLTPFVAIPDAGNGSVSVDIPVSESIVIQHVEITIDSDHTYFGDLQMVLTSPEGTTSVLSETHFASGAQLQGGFTFTSMRHLDELSDGTWRLDVIDNASFDTGNLNAVTIEIYGEQPPVLAGTCNGLPVTVDIGLGQTPTLGNDVIQGTNGPDVIVASNGDDTICGLAGDDTIVGGPGDDWVHAGPGDDSVFGLSGADIIFGGSGNDEIVSGDDDDLVYGNDGDDILNAGLGDDIVYGEAGADEVFGQAGNDFLFGGDGDDFIVGVTGVDTIEGGIGNDILNGGPGNDIVNGDAGNDTIFGLTGNDTLSGGDGNDSVFGQIGSDTVTGGTGNDELFGNEGNDFIFGISGTNTINGGPGDDNITGGSGVDNIFGDGNLQQAGNDTIDGGSGADLILGFSGVDTITSNDGITDIVNGGPGFDSCTVDAADTVFNCP